LIVPEKDTEALGLAIKTILENDSFREKLSINARQKIETWNNETMVNAFLQAINYVIKK
jgi:glycosyltransferase involved in cell wall biosynthesis